MKPTPAHTLAGRTQSPAAPPARATEPTTEENVPAAGRLLTQRDVAKQLGVSIQTLAKWHRAGKGPARILLARNVTRYNADDIKAYVERMRTAASTPM